MGRETAGERISGLLFFSDAHSTTLILRRYEVGNLRRYNVDTTSTQRRHNVELTFLYNVDRSTLIQRLIDGQNRLDYRRGP